MIFPSSVLPVLYCMLYFRSGPMTWPTDSTLLISQRPSYNSSIKNYASSSDNDETNIKNLLLSSVERSRKYYRRNRGMDTLCATVNNPNLFSIKSNVQNSDKCLLKDPNDVHKMLPGNFLSENDLKKIVFQLDSVGTSERQGSNFHSLARYTFGPAVPASFRADAHGGSQCGTCLT